jgi:uncharacterized protein (TIGR02001 family)
MIRIIAVAALAAVVGAPIQARAQETSVTANVGWTSQYYFRGILQKTSSASAGVNVARSGLSGGVWAADVGDGAEVDLFGGYGATVGSVTLSAGATGYFYTGQFDTTYLEANLGAGVGPFLAQYSFGTHDTEPESTDYSFLSLTASTRGFSLTAAAFGTDMALADVFDAGKYLELKYAFSAADLDFALSGLWSDAELANIGQVTEDDEGDPTHELTLILGVTKTFSIR